jgi:hypothetical protein
VCARGCKGNVVEYGKGIRWVAEKNVSKIRSSQSAWRSVGCKRLSVSHGAGAIVQRQIVKKQKAASEGKGRIRGFGGPKNGSVVKSPDQEEGGWRLRIGKGRGRRSLWGRGK